jgi:hypothetical protein
LFCSFEWCGSHSKEFWDNIRIVSPKPSVFHRWVFLILSKMELRLNLELEKGLTADQFYLLCHLGNYMNHKREASVSNADLSKITGFGESKLLRVKNELKEKDLLKINFSYDEKYGGQKSNTYLINTKIIEKL